MLDRYKTYVQKTDPHSYGIRPHWAGPWHLVGLFTKTQPVWCRNYFVPVENSQGTTHKLWKMQQLVGPVVKGRVNDNTY